VVGLSQQRRRSRLDLLCCLRGDRQARGIQPPQLWEATKGGPQTPVRELNLEVRPLLDELITAKATSYIKRAAAAGKPFFTYVALSHMHPPKPPTPTLTRPPLSGSAAMPM
jgi:hypothetical protein